MYTTSKNLTLLNSIVEAMVLLRTHGYLASLAFDPTALTSS